MQLLPITIEVIAKDSGGVIRKVTKSNWSGTGVVFTKKLYHLLKDKDIPGISQAGIYILMDDNSEKTTYIGEADPVGDRLKQHISSKKDWAWGIYFFDTNRKIGKTEVQYLESKLVALAQQSKRVCLGNKNIPTSPTMDSATESAAAVFLENILEILPMLGINGFTLHKKTQEIQMAPYKYQSYENSPSAVEPACLEGNKGAMDTIVVPVREKEFNQYFLEKNIWFPVRIREIHAHTMQLKFIAAYAVEPVSAVTHLATIKSIIPFNKNAKTLLGDDVRFLDGDRYKLFSKGEVIKESSTKGRYIIIFQGKAEEIQHIPRSKGSKHTMQSPRYASSTKLPIAQNLDQIWY